MYIQLHCMTFVFKMATRHSHIETLHLHSGPKQLNLQKRLGVNSGSPQISPLIKTDFDAVFSLDVISPQP